MLAQIFQKARQEAPCYLVFEDLDSIVSDDIRSFFLNEVDGLSNNDGILMVGSTNHLERLDPGISKRPSRFDRKYYFPDPDTEERVLYCEYWQGKLSDSKDVDFPNRLCTAIADLTDGFSFAYMQEAFVASLLIIAGRKDNAAGTGWNKRRGIQLWQDTSDDIVNHAAPNDADSDLDKLILWREIKLQIKILREGLDSKDVFPRESCRPCIGCRSELSSLHPSNLIRPIKSMLESQTLEFGEGPSSHYMARRNEPHTAKNSELGIKFPWETPNLNGSAQKPHVDMPLKETEELSIAAAERDRLDRGQALRDIQIALEARGDPHRQQDLKRAVDDYLSRWH